MKQELRTILHMKMSYILYLNNAVTNDLKEMGRIL